MRAISPPISAAKPVSVSRGSGFATRERTCGRSAIATASSSPAIEMSSTALRIPSLEENSRYTVGWGVSESSLIASIVVAAYPRSRNSRRAAATTAAWVRRVRA